MARQKDRDPDDALLEFIIRSNQDLMNSPECRCDVCGHTTDSETRFKAQDRILKALALKARKRKSGGSKFDFKGDDE